MEIASFLPIEQSENLENRKDGDYVEDGILHCGVCHKPKQHRIDIGDIHRLVWCICDCRVKELAEEQKKREYEEEMNRIRRMKDASMMADKYRDADFTKYNVRKENEKALRVAKKYVDNFQQMKEKNVGIIFYGPVGTGKSYTAACIANSLMEKRVPVIMTSFVKIMQDISGMEDEAKYMSLLNGCSLLIIDDLGAERSTDYALEKVYNVIDTRVRADKPMILTTNLTFDEMMRNPDVRYKRIYDRIFECCHPVEIPGQSFRIIKAAQRQEQLKKIFE